MGEHIVGRRIRQERVGVLLEHMIKIMETRMVIGD